uniref:Uncharacterized protein n=1 Tax=Triticum urartu TaxID=4572 RepID=A0A8R7PIZ9_TRIUA
FRSAYGSGSTQKRAKFLVVGKSAFRTARPVAVAARVARPLVAHSARPSSSFASPTRTPSPLSQPFCRPSRSLGRLPGMRRREGASQEEGRRRKDMARGRGGAAVGRQEFLWTIVWRKDDVQRNLPTDSVF